VKLGIIADISDYDESRLFAYAEALEAKNDKQISRALLEHLFCP
jgi:hypothetical protein